MPGCVRGTACLLGESNSQGSAKSFWFRQQSHHSTAAPPVPFPGALGKERVRNGMESSESPCEEPELSQAPACKHRGAQGARGCPFRHLFLQCTADPFVPGAPGCTQPCFLIALLTFSLSQPPLVSGSPPPPISSLSSSILTRPSSGCDLLISRVLVLSHPSAGSSGLRWPRPRSARPHLSHSPATPAAPLGRCPSPSTGGADAIPACLPRNFSPAAAASAAAGWIRSCARCQRSSPGHPQPSPQIGKTSALFASLRSFTSRKLRLPIPFPWLPFPESPRGWH